MILELVKSGCGVAALPSWVMVPAVEAKQVVALAEVITHTVTGFLESSSSR